MADLVDGYLQISHAAGQSMMCPLAFMAADVTRGKIPRFARWTATFSSVS